MPGYFRSPNLIAPHSVTLLNFLNLIGSSIIKRGTEKVFDALCYLYRFESDGVAADGHV
jgi:hypothetical protein